MTETKSPPLAEASDEELMGRYKDDDMVAFETLYDRYHRNVFAFLRRKLRDERRAEDAFQATFDKLHRSRAQYDATLPFAPWLFTIARTVALDLLRSQGREGRTFQALDGEDDALPSASTSSVDEIDLTGLSATQRRAVELRYYEDLSFEEIAARLSTSPANVRQLVSRALKQLRIWMTGARNGESNG